ncbi:class I SAM-dependent methyltransferase [Albimonas sp. CAU 1670]|uniref:class I SAM-dependent methyltransferase n=1 Tax=Albimonas sp. CAU 1670 TaxID=3032599 RepID=UPI0023DCDF8B|nr:class I SAM-dependent methyltransferase [Albimonas sp. CAU 1670]MDF2234239.1 class I SAM-dependent methyltransferase [Albimonas sp. CAU 1670]
MDPVKRQYESYPYPERDPADEARRLVEGSPSDPIEIDHFLFKGRRDWRRPFRALVAGGGTGDALVMMAQRLADAGCPAEITYLDLSEASRDVAKARMEARGLRATYEVRSLLDAPAIAAERGAFDYIDCCGVLHHLPDPDAGFAALAGALAPSGGLGLMVYAPYGRDGVYPMQDALRALLGEDEPSTQVALAREALAAAPETNGFRRNPFVTDHEASDAGLYDLLLHSRDRPYSVPELLGALEGAGLGLVSFLEPLRYDPAPHLPQTPAFAERLKRLSPQEKWALAERLSGNMRMHVAYAVKAGREGEAMAGLSAEAVPRWGGPDPRALAKKVHEEGGFAIAMAGLRHWVPIPKSAAPFLPAMAAERSFGEIARAARMDWFAFASTFGPAYRALVGVNLLHCSKGLAR